MAYDYEETARIHREMANKPKRRTKRMAALESATEAPDVSREQTPVRCLVGCHYESWPEGSSGRGTPPAVHQELCPNGATSLVRHDVEETA